MVVPVIGAPTTQSAQTDTHNLFTRLTNLPDGHLVAPIVVDLLLCTKLFPTIVHHQCVFRYIQLVPVLEEGKFVAPLTFAQLAFGQVETKLSYFRQRPIEIEVARTRNRSYV